MKSIHDKWMKIALLEAQKAFQKDEIPIGAVIVKDNKIIAKNHNRTNEFNQLAHAEKLVLEKAVKIDKFLYDYTLYVTIEPCLMCAGAIIWSRVGKVVFGSYDFKAGAAGSVYNVLFDKNFNFQPELISGILSSNCAELMRCFFQKKRKKK